MSTFEEDLKRAIKLSLEENYARNNKEISESSNNENETDVEETEEETEDEEDKYYRELSQQYVPSIPPRPGMVLKTSIQHGYVIKKWVNGH